MLDIFLLLGSSGECTTGVCKCQPSKQGDGKQSAARQVSAVLFILESHWGIQHVFINCVNNLKFVLNLLLLSNVFRSLIQK